MTAFVLRALAAAEAQLAALSQTGGFPTGHMFTIQPKKILLDGQDGVIEIDWAWGPERNQDCNLDIVGLITVIEVLDG